MLLLQTSKSFLYMLRIVTVLEKPLDICMLCGIIVPFAYTLHASTYYVTKCNNFYNGVDILMFICYYIRVDKKRKELEQWQI